jgi:hypothetical protein
MTLLNPFYLFGLAAIAIPILIHILQRDRVRKIIFPATRFLLGASKRITRTQQLREMILMILRATAVGLLAFALCRPFFYKGNIEESGPGAGGKAAVVVLDVSASMRIGKRMEDAKVQAQEFLNKYRPQLDRVAFVTFDHETNLIVPMTGDIKEVASAIDGAKGGYGGTNLAAAVQAADRILQADEVKNYAREIAVFSDLQRNGWSTYHGDWKLAPGTTLASPKPLSTKVIDNVAITQVAIPKSTVVSSRNDSISVQLVNYSTTERPELTVTLTADGVKADEKKVNLGANKTEIVRFNYKFDKPGDCAGTIVVDAKDDFAEDNTYYFNVRVLPRVQILVVNGSPNSKAAYDDGRFVNEALAVPGSPFQTREVAPDKLTPKDLEGTQAVLFTNVSHVSEVFSQALKTFVESGGGVMMFPGDRVQPEEFNASFGAVAPCRLKQVSAREEKSEGWTIGEIEFQHPIFTHFTTPQSGDFTNAKFTKYFLVTDSQSAHVLARYIDGRPALLEQSFGKGFSLLFTSTAGMKWNDFCLQGGIFVPFIHESIKHLSVHSEGITTVQLGDALSFQSPNVEVTSPDSKKLAVQQGSNNVIIAKLPGMYGVKEGDRELKLAVNIPREESDPATLDGEELVSALAATPEGQEKTIEGAKVWVQASASVKERIEGGQRIGWYLLFALMALLFAEHVLANYTSRN